MDELNERILAVMTAMSMSSSRFADELGIIRSSISHIINGRNKPSLEVIQKILQRFPEISPEWVVLGKGMMLKATETKDEGWEIYSQRPEAVQAGSPKPQMVQASLFGDDQSFKPQIQEQEAARHEPQAVPNQTSPAMPTEVVKPEKSGAVSLAEISTGSIRRIVVYFNDNTYRDFTEAS